MHDTQIEGQVDKIAAPLWVIAVCLIGILLCLLWGDAHAESAVVSFNDAEQLDGDSVMVLMNCRGVPDSCVLRGYETAALIRYDEWGDPYVVDEETCLDCPVGTKKMGGKAGFYLASNPPMREVSCWTVKTVCDTTWREVKR